jgi:hypothetical protein
VPPASPATTRTPSTTRLRTRTVLGAAVAALLAATVLPAAPAAARPVQPLATKLKVNVAAAATQCNMGFGVRKAKTDRHDALELMSGRADLGEYGWFRLAANPSWKPVATLDSSGKGHMHSLHYLLPLLRFGVRSGDQAMVDRFYYLIKDWLQDNPPGGATSRYAWGPPIYEGFRAQVLVCAAAGPQGRQQWLLRGLLRHGQVLGDPGRYEGVNNASLHQSMGLYSLGEAMMRPKWRATAISREASLAVKLIQPDGSDEEGALEYAVNDYRWFAQAAERLRRGGDAVPAELNRYSAMPAFIAQATRPDGKIEALGDTTPVPLVASRWAGTAAEFSATNGASGVAPPSVFSAFAGGYVFGRSGWGTSRPLADETFFSVRGGRATPHAHDDSGAVTLYSHGSPLLVDTGKWRYTYGTTRSFVVSRAAHNAVLVNGVPRTRLRPEMSATTANGLDITTVVDRGYAGVTLTRTVAYDRADDVLVVWDRLSSPTKAVTASQQWGLGRDRQVSVTGDVAHTAGPGANVSMLFTSGGAPLDVAKGQKDPMRGWNSQAYGELSPSPSLRATQKGNELSWLTVIAPRASGVEPSAVAASATVSQSDARVALNAPNGNAATVYLDGAGGSRTDWAPVTPVAVPTADIVLQGSQTVLRGRGLTPGESATIEMLPAGATTWAIAAQGTATAAGTVDLPVTASATADYRVVTESGVSTPVHVTAAVAPQPVTGVTATPSGRGEVTVTWVPPTDTGGTPLTDFVVEHAGTKTVVPPTATSFVLTGVVPGDRVVKVRARNAVARTPWATATATVPAYPSISGPSTVRKGSKVTLTLRGLLPGERPVVTVDPAKGATVTRRPVVTSKGTATVTYWVKSRTRFVVVSGGVRSAPKVIRLR